MRFSHRFILLSLLLASLPSVCSTRHGRREIRTRHRLGIVSYTHRPASAAKCIFSSARFVRVLSEEARFPLSTAVIRTTQEALRPLYVLLGNESPAYQVELTRHWSS